MANKQPTHKQMIEERKRRKQEAELKAKAQKKKQTIGIVCGAAGVVLIIALIIVLLMQPWADDAVYTTGNGGSTQASATESETAWVFKHDMEVKHHVEIEVKDYGVIKLELDPTYAPITVDNFLNLVEEGFYNGLTFHRIMDGFMIQGGDPNHDSTGGSSTTIKGEFSANGVENPLEHKRGVISMARSSAYNSASSQFFIVHTDYPSLNGQYAAFGVVTEGMEVVDAIVEAANPTDGNGTIKYSEQPVITQITIID